MSKPRKAQTVMTHKVQLATLLTKTGGKQPGRRFGPPVTNSWPMPGVAPTGTDRREAIYRAQTGRIRRPMTSRMDAATSPKAYALLMGLTPKQRRRAWHKELTAARILGDRELARKADAALMEVAA